MLYMSMGNPDSAAGRSARSDDGIRSNGNSNANGDEGCAGLNGGTDAGAGMAAGLDPTLAAAQSRRIVPEEPEAVSVEQFADLALEVGVTLLSAGAHSGRVYSNIKRFADRWGFPIHIHPTFTGLIVTVRDNVQPERTVTRYHDAPHPRVHLLKLTLFSRLSWRTLDHRLSFAEVKHQIEQIKAAPHYPPVVMVPAVGVACGCLCMLFGGDLLNGLCAFFAAAVGSLARLWMHKRGFNAMLVTVAAAFVATMIAGVDTIYYIGGSPEATLATSVLFLIPGVPLLNSVIDLIEGYLAASVARSLFAGFSILCIAAGMTIAITLLGIENF